MCGILGILAGRGRAISVGENAVRTMRDTMASRGPDGAGLWMGESVALAHRRLAVIDLTDSGAQPMSTPDGRYWLVYNGEIYNDAEVRRLLAHDGVRFRSSCDTETVLHALVKWGVDALPRLRGMFAFGFYDSLERRLLLARDPLGVKPLFYARLDGALVFASEIRAILAHPGFSSSPDLPMCSAYLTTSRTVLGDRTLYEHVNVLEAGSMLDCDASEPELRTRTTRWWAAGAAGGMDPDDENVRACIEDAVRSHLRSDAPLCSLLSGGLDSTITTSVANASLDSLRTYAAGAICDGNMGDLEWAQVVADELGTTHATAIIDESLFADRWDWMVRALRAPLSTPNEVAIYEVAAHLREDECVVTLSGEGADELFGGYEPVLRDLYSSEAATSRARARRFLDAISWVSVDHKPALLRIDAWEAIGRDGWLLDVMEHEFARCEGESGADADPLEPALRMLQSINLVGLLGRLDSSTMLASVEGRTPFADSKVAELAASLPMSRKFVAGERPGDACGGGLAVATRANTKIALRSAFAGRLVAGVAERTKASFPLPFQQWMGSATGSLRTSDLAQRLLRPEVLHAINLAPEANWRIAWPALNLAMWSSRIW